VRNVAIMAWPTKILYKPYTSIF